MIEEQTGIKTKNLKNLEEIESIYNKKELSFSNIKKNPILKPILEINKSFVNLELIINKALHDYEKDEKEINEMIKINPTYSETMIMARVQNLKSSITQIIHSQDLQKENMKKAINEMIEIVGEEYGLLEETSEDIGESEMDVEKKHKLEKTIGNKKETFHSNLLNKELPKPKEGGLIPVKEE